MSEVVQYSVRDPYGNVYGPATAELLRHWVLEGRIIPGMSVGSTVAGATQWQEASTHPAIADLFHPVPGTPTVAITPLPASPAASAQATPQWTPAQIDYAQPRRPSRLPVASLILGVSAFVFCVPSPLLCCCGAFSLPLALAGLVTGLIAVFESRPPGTDQGGKTPAYIGIILSLLALLITVIGWVVQAAAQWKIFHPPGGL